MDTPETSHNLESYEYNSFGQVKRRTDPRGVITNYSYDTLNRLKDIGYDVGTTQIPATPAVSYEYGTDANANNNGRLLTMTDGTGSETYSYNELGLLTGVSKVIGGVTYAITYGYNLAGEVNSVTYPSGRVVRQEYDTVGRLASIGSGSTTYLTIPSGKYTPSGQITGFTYGNGVEAAFGFNPRLQLTSLRYFKSTTDLLNLAYNYGAANNGMIRDIKYYSSPGVEDQTRSQNYEYGPRGRLKKAWTTNLTAPNTWRLEWTYDDWGNRLSQTLTGGPLSVTQPQLTFDARSWIITSGYSYLEPPQNVTMGNLVNDVLSIGSELRRKAQRHYPTREQSACRFWRSTVARSSDAGAGEG